MLDILEQYYSNNGKSGGCTVKHQDNPTLHERCFCKGKHVSFCKALCDDDLKCKGYAETNDQKSCALATDSECQEKSSCTKYGKGHLGLLEAEGKYGYSFYANCSIKGKFIQQTPIEALEMT